MMGVIIMKTVIGVIIIRIGKIIKKTILVMKENILFLLLTALLLCCLDSCNKPDNDVEDIPKEPEEIHPYELKIPADGLDKVNFLDLCVNLTSSLQYEFTLDEDCDWVEFSTSAPEFGETFPYMTVHPNTTGEPRSAEVTIQSSPMSSHMFFEKHLIVQSAE